jgi:lysophospholipase L1-like esterase
MRITDKLAKRNADPFGAAPATIVCLGDSVTHGCFDCRLDRHGRVDTDFIASLSYARKLEDQIYKLYPVAAANVINAGISGDSAAGALKRFDRDVACYSPDLVVVNLGLNDCMDQDEAGALERYASSMKGLFQKTAEIGAECILLTPNMMCKYVDSSLKEEILREIALAASQRQNGGVLDRFVDAAREVARSMGVPIADAYASWKKYAENGVDTTQLLANHINHPLPDMHDVFANRVVDVIMER